MTVAPLTTFGSHHLRNFYNTHPFLIHFHLMRIHMNTWLAVSRRMRFRLYSITHPTPVNIPHGHPSSFLLHARPWTVTARRIWIPRGGSQLGPDVIRSVEVSHSDPPRWGFFSHGGHGIRCPRGHIGKGLLINEKEMKSNERILSFSINED